MCDDCYTTLRKPYLEWLGLQHLLASLPAGGGSKFQRKISAALTATLVTPVRALTAKTGFKVEMTRGEWHQLIQLFAGQRAIGHRHTAAVLKASLTEAEVEQWRIIKKDQRFGYLVSDTHVPIPRHLTRWTDNQKVA